MSEITQKLGFDAASAIRQLTDLHRALSTVNADLGRMNLLTGKLDSSALARSSQNIARNLGKVKSGFKEVGSQAKSTSNDITLSWNTVARVVQAQIIVRALRQIINGFL